MEQLKIFENEEFGQVRTINIDGEPWFVGKDVAKILGYKDTSDAMRRHVDDEDKLTRCFTDSGQKRELYIINESGLYSVILSSKLPSAKRFKRWVTSEVLPVIRKTGSYTNRDGNKVYTTDVVVEDQEFAESKAAAQRNREESSQERPEPMPVDENGFMTLPEDFDEELPFA